jgi:hypothetical protein
MGGFSMSLRQPIGPFSDVWGGSVSSMPMNFTVSTVNPDAQGGLPLYIAMTNDDAAMTQLLVDHGASTDKDTMLWYATSYSNPEIDRIVNKDKYTTQSSSLPPVRVISRADLDDGNYTTIIPADLPPPPGPSI